MEVAGEPGEGSYYKDTDEALMAYANGDLGLHALVWIRMYKDLLLLIIHVRLYSLLLFFLSFSLLLGSLFLNRIRVLVSMYSIQCRLRWRPNGSSRSIITRSTSRSKILNVISGIMISFVLTVIAPFVEYLYPVDFI